MPSGISEDLGSPRSSQAKFMLAAACLLAGCARTASVTTAKLELLELPSCELAAADALVLRALGDFPAQQRTLSTRKAVTLDGLPVATSLLEIEARQGAEHAGGIAPLERGVDLSRAVLMLPFGRSCPLGDPLARAPVGASVAALPGGGLLVAGGQDDAGAATSNAFVLPPGEVLVRQVASGLFLRRTDATATAVGSSVVVVGGGQDARSSAHDTFEIFDAEAQRFDRGRSGNLVSGPRRSHGAARLPDGRVLVVGGQTDLGGAALSTAELVDPLRSRAEATSGELAFARVAPSVLVLDSGTVLIALGRAGGGDATPLPEIERFDSARGTFATLDARLPARARAAVVALEGDRVLYVGCDGGAAGCELALLLPRGDDFELAAADPRFAPDALAAAGLEDVDSLRAVALHDGRVLVTGRRSGQAIARQAFVIDLGAAQVTAAPEFVSRVPDQSIELADGSLAQLDADGLSLGRSDLRSELDDAGALLPSKEPALALDDARRFQIEEDGALLAVVDARVDLPLLRFGAVRVEIALQGGGELLLEPMLRAPLAIAIRPDAVTTTGCARVARTAGALAIERRGATLTLQSGANRAACTTTLPEERVGIALRLDAGSRVRSLRVTRL